MRKFILSITSSIARNMPGRWQQYIYNLGPMTRGIRRLLNQAAPKGIHLVEIAAGLNQGLKMYLDLQEEKDLWLGTYEQALQNVITQYVRPGMVIYDLGANIGYISLMFAQKIQADGRVYAFEALPDNILRLKANIEANHFLERVEVIHAAVLDHSGEVEFLVHASPGMGKAVGSGGRNEAYKEHIQVKAISLDHFIQDTKSLPPDIVKIDIEGGETMALPGMSNLLETNQPIILMELHGEAAADIAWEVLTKYQYKLHELKPELPIIPSRGSMHWKTYLIALPKQG